MRKESTNIEKIESLDLNPVDIAKYILWYANQSGELITNLKLQKLVYYAQAWYIALHDKSLFEEDFQAWIHGPVLKSIYTKYNQGFKPIQTDDVTNLNDTFKKHPELETFFKSLFKAYFPRGAYELELMTHKESPWIEARDGLGPLEKSEEIISKQSMKKYYGEKANANKSNKY